MRIRLYRVDQDTGAETFERSCDLDIAFDDLSIPEVIAIESELQKSGRCWIGGGAAQMFLAMVQR